MTKHTIVCYRQYGNWSSTRPFASRKDAETHAIQYLRDNQIKAPNNDVIASNTRSHIKDITFFDIELPE